MDILERTLMVGPLRRPSEWIPPLRSMLDGLGKSLHLTNDELAALHAVPDLVVFPVYAQLISHIALTFAGICCRVRFNYEPSEGDRDELDVALVQLMDCGVERLELHVCVGNASYARYLGADKMLALSSDRLDIKLVQLDEDQAFNATHDTATAPAHEAEKEEEESTSNGGMLSGAHEACQADANAIEGAPALTVDMAKDAGTAAKDSMNQEDSHGNAGVGKS